VPEANATTDAAAQATQYRIWTDYARAAVRLATGRHCRDWTDAEILQTFALLPAQHADLMRWMSACSMDPAAPGVPDLAPDPVDLTEDEIREHNERALQSGGMADLKAMGVKVRLLKDDPDQPEPLPPLTERTEGVTD